MTEIKMENGRSMVEMLGVLAVAGVLSIGGVAGYRWVMDKYRANDTIRELSQRAVVHSQQMLAGNTVLSNAEFNPANQTRLGYGLTQAILAAQPDFFEIRLSDVPERVCQNIIDSDWVLPSGWEINGSSEDGVMCAATNSMAFFFHRVLDNTKVANGEEVTEEAGEPCSGHGVWNGESCTCDNCYCGTDCSTLTCTYDESECNGHGVVWCGGYCLCDRGWYGDWYGSCAVQGDFCNGHGVFNGCGCRCDAGWSGRACNDNVDRCNGHGVFETFVGFYSFCGCRCDDGWYGDDCSSDAPVSTYTDYETTYTDYETTYTDYETTYTDYETTYTDYETTVSGDSEMTCSEGTFYNGYTKSCTVCPTEGNAVQNNSSDMEDSCEKCTGAQSGGADPYYCVYCPSGVVCGDQCCGDGEMCQYSSGTYACVSTLGEGECFTNEDCTGENQYCRNSSTCEITIGTCETVNSTTVTINGTEYTASTGGIPYHAAENFCEALGKTLAPVTDGCTAEELATVKANNYYGGGFTGSCTGWAHTTGNEYWTATKLSGCTSYYVSSHSSGAAGALEWLYSTYFALCR